MNKKNGKLTNAFTLAEVLITLLIIGVIVSIVLPNLINDSKDAELKTAWKKAYASINQAYGEILIDNGGTFVNAATGSTNLRNIFQNKMNYLTTCSDSSCAADSIKALNGSDDTTHHFTRNLVLNDSVTIHFTLNSEDCTHTGSVKDSGECGWLLVDVNGKKKPNQWGKDIYGIWILNNQILPWGANPTGVASTSYTEDTCSSSDTGYGCGAKYLHE